MNGRCAADLTTPTILGTPVLFHRKTCERVSTFGALPILPGRGRSVARVSSCGKTMGRQG
jgi:hypothetical protein